MVVGCVLRTAGSFLIQNYADLLTLLQLLNNYLTLAMMPTYTADVPHAARVVGGGGNAQMSILEKNKNLTNLLWYVKLNHEAL